MNVSLMIIFSGSFLFETGLLQIVFYHGHIFSF